MWLLYHLIISSTYLIFVVLIYLLTNLKKLKNGVMTVPNLYSLPSLSLVTIFFLSLILSPSVNIWSTSLFHNSLKWCKERLLNRCCLSLPNIQSVLRVFTNSCKIPISAGDKSYWLTTICGWRRRDLERSRTTSRVLAVKLRSHQRSQQISDGRSAWHNSSIIRAWLR